MKRGSAWVFSGRLRDSQRERSLVLFTDTCHSGRNERRHSRRVPRASPAAKATRRPDRWSQCCPPRAISNRSNGCNLVVSLQPDMATDEERCAEARKLERIDAAFREGDLGALRAAVGDGGSAERPDAAHYRIVPGPCDLSQPACVHPDAARDRRRSQRPRGRRLSAADCGALLRPRRAGRAGVPTSTRFFDYCCRSARIRTSAASTTTRRFIWQLPGGTPWRFRSSSTAAPIRLSGRGSTSVRRRCRWRNRAGLAAMASVLAHARQPLRRRLRPGPLRAR